jgi:hypothetical protein
MNLEEKEKMYNKREDQILKKQLQHLNEKLKSLESYNM